LRGEIGMWAVPGDLPDTSGLGRASGAGALGEEVSHSRPRCLFKWAGKAHIL
jgi:hypothetical protein